MMRRLLELMDTRSMTLSEMALELGMSESDLKNRMEIMASMGHLEAITIDGDSVEPEADCPGCIMASRCKDDTCSDGVHVVGYRLTDKGRRLAKGGGD